MASIKQDDCYEYRVIHGPYCRIIAGWAIPMFDGSALLSAWARDGYRYTSTKLQLKYGVAIIAMRDPAEEDKVDEWYQCYITCDNTNGDKVCHDGSSDKQH